MELEDIIEILDEIAPPELAESIDKGKIGLVVKGRSYSIRKVVTALDPTPFVIQKAIDMGANMVITHHTLIWNPINKIPDTISKQLKMLYKADMSLFAMHTNYDKATGGVNDVLSQLLGMKYVWHNGLCNAGRIEPSKSLESYALTVGTALGTGYVRYVGDPEKEIRGVISVAGSGFREGLNLALRQQVQPDAIVSSELHHDIIRDAGDIALIEVPHYYSEAPAMKALADRLTAGKGIEAVYVNDPITFRSI
jgi:dinuclear metal center YbgI/SA1388 family protein